MARKKALNKDIRVEIKKSLGRYISIFLIVALGVSFFSGLRSTESDMRYTGDAFSDRSNLMDIRVISTMGLTDDDVEALSQVEGISGAEPGYMKEVVKEKFMDYMPEKFKGMELVAEPVEKVNVTLDGIILREEGRNISPTIYINDMYKKYQDCGDLEETLMAACDFMERAYEQTPVVDVDSIMRDANEKIVFQLINTEQNKTFLEQVPHREFQDLSIVYKVIISADKDAVQSSKITNEFAKRLGMSEEQLFKCAAENTRRLFPPVVRSMNDIMKEMFARDGMPQEIAEMMIAEIPPEQTMWVISNEKGINGAASMLYENELHELAESLESDLYILPSSVHEVIAVSSDMGSPEMLAQMVVEVNMQEVSLDERLSNQVYHYDKDLRKLTLATDTPNKRLDGIVAEPPLVYDAKEKSR